MLVQKTKVLQISLLAIFSAFIVELVFGLISNSLGLITDSIHALLDSVVTAILLLAARLAIKPPDEEHTYGHGKIESLGGMIGGIAIFLIAGFFIYESIQRLQSPLPSTLPGVFAIIGIVLVSYGFYNGDFVAALILGVVLVILSLKLMHKTALDLTDIISPE